MSVGSTLISNSFSGLPLYSARTSGKPSGERVLCCINSLTCSLFIGLMVAIAPSPVTVGDGSRLGFVEGFAVGVGKSVGISWGSGFSSPSLIS
ncbi:MAG: hypothetical protein ACK513_09570 [Aphanizomenon sp.]